MTSDMFLASDIKQPGDFILSSAQLTSSEDGGFDISSLPRGFFKISGPSRLGSNVVDAKFIIQYGVQ